eukprot:TRINITY_DN114048_c0_g1_i1.p1 TRINITY_DN114048_c0_g1~~TRINITY_DN114048_c0_g1_i1.p1  ORF type:complete len:112 (+),score=15.85 TRINITY_DN114048_c0_g1_i1:84-419(+)
MAVKLWMIVVGVTIIVHAGTTILAEKRAALEAADPLGEEPSPVTFQVFLEVVCGACMVLWGGIGEFKPIKLGDPKKPRWESLHARPDFQSYRTRARVLRPLLTSVPAPPES